MEPVLNGDWLKSFRLLLGVSAGENSNKTPLTSSAFATPLLFAFSLLLTFFTLFSEAFCFPYSRCSALDTCPFTWAFSCPLLRSSRCFHAHFFHVVSCFLARTYYYFSPLPIYFHWNQISACILCLNHRITNFLFHYYFRFYYFNFSIGITS